MDSISIKQARQNFAKLINSAGRGQAVAITRRGKPVAQITPAQPTTRPRLPDLTAFRDSLGGPAKPAKSAIRRLRSQERY